ncbi:MAG: 4-hydroxybenzoate 3-monooxygenase [Dermatophilaceae bacterium]
MSEREIEKTTVGIVGGGPAGLMLAHLLSKAGIDTIAIDDRTRDLIETTHRAGILEAQAVRMLLDEGVSDRILRDGFEHEGIFLRFNGESHRIDFKKLVNESVWLYPQQDVFIDLADARARDGGKVYFGISGTQVEGVEGDHPVIRFTDADGVDREIQCEIVVGADGSRSICRNLVPEAKRNQFFREYPFAWFGILCEAPFSAPELIYSHSERGFALISQRTPSVQRMYFQCDPTENVDNWSEDRIWAELQGRLQGADGFQLKEGPIFEKTVLIFRSFVQETMRWGRLVLAGDAGHTVPPTGAKGLNLAFNDVRLLAPAIVKALETKNMDALDEYPPKALERIWKAQHFSYWMTQMLHRPIDATDFDVRRQVGELLMVTGSQHGSTYLAEAYTGWPDA